MIFEVTTADQSLTLGGTLNIENINGGSDKNAYSILVDTKTTQDLSIKADNAQSILVKALPTTTKAGGKAYVYANNSDKKVTFSKVNLTVNNAAVTDQGVYGIYSGIDGAKFKFGTAATTSSTEYGIDNSAVTDGKDAKGLIIAGNTTFEGTLKFTALKASKGVAGTKGGDGSTRANGADGAAAGHGGNAYGITAGTNGKTLTLDGANITFAAINGGAGGDAGQGGNSNGGNGGKGGKGGNGGDASGIYLDSTNNLTIDGNGKITFTTITGGTKAAAGAAGTSRAGTAGQGGDAGDKDGTAYIINNAGTGILTLGSAAVAGDNAKPATTVSIIAGTANLADHTVGISDNLAGKYVFGTTGQSSRDGAQTPAAPKVGQTAMYVSGVNGSDASSNKDGKNAIGLYLQGIANGTAEFSGNLTAQVTGGSGFASDGSATGGNGGNAYGLILNKTAANAKNNLELSNSIITLNVKGGKAGNGVAARGAQSQGNAGSAYGIHATGSEAITIAGDGQSKININLTAGDSTGNAGAQGTAGKLYVIDNAITNNAQKNLKLSNVSIIAGDGTNAPASGYGIYHSLKDAIYNFGTEAKKTATELDNGTAGTNNAGSEFTGMIVANDGSANGHLIITGQNANGAEQSTAPAGRAAGDGLKGGNATGLELRNGIFGFDALTLDVKGGNGSVGSDAQKNAGSGGDATGIKASSGTLNLTGNSKIVVTGGEKGTTGKNGTQGNAYGIYTTGDFTITGYKANTNTLSLTVNGNNAHGIYLAGAGKTVNGANAANEVDLGTIVFDDAAGTNPVITGSAKAYGIYNAAGANNKLSGTITFGDGTNAAVGSDTATEVYGIYNAGKLELAGKIEFEDAALKVKAGGTATHLYNAGDLTFAADSSVFIKGFLQTPPSANLFAGKSKTLNVMLDAGSTTTFNGTTGIGGAGIVKLTMGENATLNFEKTGISGSGTVDITTGVGSTLNFGGVAFSNTGAANLTVGAGSVITFNGKAFADNSKANLTLNAPVTKTDSADTAKKTGATLVFNADAGTVATLKGSNAEILLSGSADKLNERFGITAQPKVVAPTFTARKLIVTKMGLDQSDFVLGAYVDDKGVKTADSIEISNIDDTVITGNKNSVNNTLHVSVNKYSATDKYVVLAKVANSVKDKVIFNDLKKDGETVNATVAVGFTNGDVEIKRFDDTATKSTYYASDLRTTNISVNSDFVAPATVALSTGISLFSANLNSLSKRMGELRNDPYSQGAWARVFAGEMTTDFGGKQSTVYSTIQAGYDYKLGLDNAANYMGVAISYTKGSGGQVNPALSVSPAPLNLPVAGLSSSNTNGVEVALYNSYVSASGLYSDTIAKFGYYMSDLTMPLINDPYSISNFAAAISEELGYKVSLGENNEWFITPQGEVAFAYMGGSNFTQNFDIYSLKSSQDATSLLRARVGAAWGYDFSYLAKESNLKASIYLGTYYTYDYFIGGDTTLTATGGGKSVDFTHNAYEATGRFVMNLGTNIDVQDRTKVYFDFEKSFGGKIQTDYQVSLGVRFGLGEKVSAPKQEEKKETEPALKPKELDESAK